MKNNMRFDAMLVQDLECAHLPCSILKQIKPWSLAFKHIMLGYVLMWLAAFSLSFAPRHPDKPWLIFLGNLFAVLQAALVYIGFRSLRNVNRCFFFCWIVTMLPIVHTVWEVGLGKHVLDHADTVPLDWLGFAVNTAFFLCIWWGILCVQRSAGQSTRRSPAHLILIYYALIILLPRLDLICTCLPPRLATTVDLILHLLAYFFTLSLFAIFVTLSKIPTSLDQIGYVLIPAHVRLSPIPFCGLCLAVTAVLRLISHILYNTPLM